MTPIQTLPFTPIGQSQSSRQQQNPNSDPFYTPTSAGSLCPPLPSSMANQYTPPDCLDTLPTHRLHSSFEGATISPFPTLSSQNYLRHNRTYPMLQPIQPQQQFCYPNQPSFYGSVPQLRSQHQPFEQMGHLTSQFHHASQLLTPPPSAVQQHSLDLNSASLSLSTPTAPSMPNPPPLLPSQSEPLKSPLGTSPAEVKRESSSSVNALQDCVPAGTAPGPIPATTPTVVRQDRNGIHWIAFEYSKDRIKTRYTIRCDVESVNAEQLPCEFKEANCVYPRAFCEAAKYTGNRYAYESDCNTVGWSLAELNPQLRGKRGLIQRAVDSWRNSNSDSRLRSRRVRRMNKTIARKTQPPELAARGIKDLSQKPLPVAGGGFLPAEYRFARSPGTRLSNPSSAPLSWPINSSQYAMPPALPPSFAHIYDPSRMLSSASEQSRKHTPQARSQQKHLSRSGHATPLGWPEAMDNDLNPARTSLDRVTIGNRYTDYSSSEAQAALARDIRNGPASAPAGTTTFPRSRCASPRSAVATPSRLEQYLPASNLIPSMQ